MQRRGGFDPLYKETRRFPFIDATDFRLIATLRHDPAATHADLARIIDRSESTVRRRLSALHDAGVLTGFIAVPDPRALDLEGAAATWATSTPADALLAVPGTVMAGNSIGGGTLAGGFSADAAAWVKAASAVVGEAPATTTRLDKYAGPPLGSLELRTLRAVIQTPRGTAADLAAASGLSAKTVRKIRARLVADRAFTLYPLVRLSTSGAAVYHLHVTCTVAQRPAVIAALGDASVTRDDDPMLCAFVRAESLAEQAKTIEAVRGLGVDNVEVVHENEWVVRSEVVVGFVDGVLRKWGK